MLRVKMKKKPDLWALLILALILILVGGAGPFVLPSEDYFLPFLRVYERAYTERMKTVLPHRLKLYEPVADDPLQTLQLVNDGREILAALPGIGLERATLAIQKWRSEER